MHGSPVRIHVSILKYTLSVHPFYHDRRQAALSLRFLQRLISSCATDRSATSFANARITPASRPHRSRPIKGRAAAPARPLRSGMPGSRPMRMQHITMATGEDVDGLAGTIKVLLQLCAKKQLRDWYAKSSSSWLRLCLNAGLTTTVREQHPRSCHKGATSMQTHPVVRLGSNWRPTASSSVFAN